MIEYKCKNCGAPLTPVNGEFFCEFCHSHYYDESVSLPSNSNCTIVNGFLQKYNGAEQVVYIPDNVCVIGPNAFAGNMFIEKVVFTPKVHTISNNAFENCTGLKEIVNYTGIKIFQRECFKGAGLKEITIGNQVMTLGEGCFSCMPDLEAVYYYPHKDFQLKYTFAKCPSLTTVKMDKLYFFPSFQPGTQVRNNVNDRRPTFNDAFWKTPFATAKREEYMKSYEKGVCPECGGAIKKGLFHAKCQQCGIDYKN